MPIASYIVATFAMLFCGASALVLIYTVGHFDPPERTKGH